ncbi:MAG: hypothetical protein IPG66_16325 [Hydrogenophilales bacterium]|nr:hypothetical protein [Hydrogenophilales bacterium]
MIEKLIFKWAESTPDKPALIHNGIPISYKSLSHLIKLAKGYFSRRGYHGPGYVALYQYNLSDFWILSLALRSLGFTTISVPNKAWFSRPSLPSIRYVFTTEGDNQNGLNDCCAQLGVPVISVSLANEPVNSIDDSIEKYSHGGHILLTSGTTGTYKMVLVTPRWTRFFTKKSRPDRDGARFSALRIWLWRLDRRRLQMGRQSLACGRHYGHSTIA